MSEKCNKCGDREAVADWGICWKCFQSQCDRWAAELVSKEEDDDDRE